MNYNLNYEGFENYLVEQWTDFGGAHYRFRFENGFGASVIKGPYTYGGPDDFWELGVLMFYHDDKGFLTYRTEITDDVIGYQTDEMIRKLLGRIKALEDPFKENT